LAAFGGRGDNRSAMGLDIFVGSYTRYYAGDWETVVQRYGWQNGLPVEGVQRSHGPDAVTDPEQIRPSIVAWRDQLSAGLGDNLDRPLDWDESASAPYFTDKPAWDGYAALLLWASYADHPDLKNPREHPTIGRLTRLPAQRDERELFVRTIAS